MTGVPPSLEDRARGALLGLACGDALGAPLDGMGRESARIRHGRVDRFLGGGQHLLAPGDVTARALLARALATTLLEGPPSVERALDAYEAVARSGAVGLGDVTRAVLSRIASGTDRAVAVAEAHATLERRSAGIGPAIRAVPLALRLHAEPEALVEAVLADARSTHADPRAHAAAVALALWVRAHLAGEDDPVVALDAVREAMALRPELPDVLPAPAAVSGYPVRATAFAPDVLHAVARHVLGARTVEAAIVGAANEAGQASAIGAATGAVAGARFGAAALPRRWTTLLRGAATWRALADRLVAVPAA